MQASSLSDIFSFIENESTLGNSLITTKEVRYQSKRVCYVWPVRDISMSLAHEELYRRSSIIRAFPQKCKKQGGEVLGGNYPVLLCQPQIPHDLTRADELGSRRLTA
jgi:hypothetical protein